MNGSFHHPPLPDLHVLSETILTAGLGVFAVVFVLMALFEMMRNM